jgi:hypothetical protein
MIKTIKIQSFFIYSVRVLFSSNDFKFSLQHFLLYYMFSVKSIIEGIEFGFTDVSSVPPTYTQGSNQNHANTSVKRQSGQSNIGR